MIRPLNLADLDLRFTVEPSIDDAGPVEIEGHRCRITETGASAIRLIVQTNPGEQAAEAAKIASGGEKSRIYLGLAALELDRREDASRPLLLFDEIDAGLGMDSASIMGDMLGTMAAGGQIIAITHWPTMAVKGERHLRAEKRVRDGRAVLAVETIEGDERVAELVRLLGGDSDDAEEAEARRSYARRLLAGGGQAALEFGG